MASAARWRWQKTGECWGAGAGRWDAAAEVAPGSRSTCASGADWKGSVTALPYAADSMLDVAGSAYSPIASRKAPLAFEYFPRGELMNPGTTRSRNIRVPLTFLRLGFLRSASPIKKFSRNSMSSACCGLQKAPLGVSRAMK